MTLILRKISRKFGRRIILNNLNLEVREGEILALLGPSGCGKSTTLRIIAGLERPDTGEILINGANMTHIPPVDRKIGMVFQNYALFPHLSVGENLSLGLNIRGVPNKQIQVRVSSILGLMKLDDHVNKLPAELSGGQRQRVALARALLRDPSIYLLDEPMSNLDAQLREDLRPELRSLITSENKPVVYVTHDQNEAMALANRIAILNNGVIEQIDTPQDIYKNPKTYFVASFIGSPKINTVNQSNEILSAVRPEDIYFSEEGLNCKVLAREWHGKNQIIILDCSKGILRMICDVDTKIPTNTKVSWDKDKVYRFNINTGKRSILTT